jgi:hemerythrin
MAALRKIEVSTGICWVEAPSVNRRILCGCPADAVKHLMKRGLVLPTESNGVVYESGPNAILLSDVMIQNGVFSNLAEFPVLQMLYRQGMIVPGHPGNTGSRPVLIGSPAQLRAQMAYIHRGNYGLVSQDELIAAGVPQAEARDMMRLKLKFAFGAIRDPSDLLDTVAVESGPADLGDGLTVRRLRLNVFEFALGEERVVADLNLPPSETYECPYPLGFHYIPREYFAVVHSGEGDGWDINRPSMGSILMFQGRIYLIDAGPNIVATLTALGIGINEIEGIFHTHSHDDHFAGLTALFRSDHRIKYYATPMVRAAVAKKMAALLSIEEKVFADYFDVRPLVPDEWNDVDGLDVRPIFSPHPVETTLFLFRAMWADGYRTYAHYADICRLSVLKGFVTEDPAAPGLSEELYETVLRNYSIPADVKKIDVGGGMIHGDANDFRDDLSGKIILAHTAERHTVAQRAIGSAAAFGTVDAIIPSDHDFIWRSAFEVLTAAFPDVPYHQLRILLNSRMVTFNPGTILLKEGQTTKDIWIVLSGSVETIHSGGDVRSVVSSGAIVGELAGLFGVPAAETYRAQGFVKALRVASSLYTAFVRRNKLLDDIAMQLERREFLQRTWLFGEVVSVRTLNTLVRESRPITVAAGETVEVGACSMGLVQRGRLARQVGDETVGMIGPGGFFGEEVSVFQTASDFHLRAMEPTDILVVSADLVANVPSVRWRLFEEWGKRMSIVSAGSGYQGRTIKWSEECRVDVLVVDNYHRRLFDLANAVLDLDREEGPAAQVADALGGMLDYALYHFGEEDALLDRCGFPDVASNRASHAALAARLAALRDDVRAGALRGKGLEQTLTAWLRSHVCDGDRQFGAFLNGKGIY